MTIDRNIKKIKIDKDESNKRSKKEKRKRYLRKLLEKKRRKRENRRKLELDHEWEKNYQVRLENIRQIFYGKPVKYEKLNSSSSFNRLLGVKHHEIPIPEKFETPIVSVLCPTIRVSAILDLYRSLLSNETPFEVIFVGPEEPQFPLPANCRWITATVRAAQCYFIAMSNARGKYVTAMCDDFFVSDHFLDKMVAQKTEICASKGQRIWWTSTLEFKRRDYREMVWMFDRELIMGLGMNSKCKYKWGHDLEHRFVRSGGKIIPCHDTIVWEIMHFVDMPRLIESIRRMYSEITSYTDNYKSCHRIQAIQMIYDEIISHADKCKSVTQVPSMAELNDLELNILSTSNAQVPDIADVAEPIISAIAHKRTVKFNIRYGGKERSGSQKFVPYKYTKDICRINQW